MSLTVRRATAADISAIQALEQEAFEVTWDEATFARELQRDNGATVVAEVDGELVGSALLVWAGPEVQLNSIVLAPSWRGRGLSKPFLGSLLKWCRSEGFHWITLEVKWNNPPAFALYDFFGFVTTARRPKYYRDGQDARIMWAGHLQHQCFDSALSIYEQPQPLRRAS